MAISPSDHISADNFQDAKKEQLAATMETFEHQTVLWPLIDKEHIMNQKTYERTVLGKATAGRIHEPGTKMTGASLSTTQRPVDLEDRKTYENYLRTFPEHITDHTDTAIQLGGLAGTAVGLATDRQAFQQLALGAATAASGDFPGGVTEQVSGATIEAAFPKSLAGSEAIQDVLADWRQTMSENATDNDGNDLFCFLSPYLYKVLKQDKTLSDKDYDGPDVGNSRIRGKVIVAENFNIISTSLLPTTDLSAATNGPQAYGQYLYRGDFTQTAFLGMKAGGLKAVHTNMVAWDHYEQTEDQWYIGAGFMKGMATKRPEFCMSCTIDGV